MKKPISNWIRTKLKGRKCAFLAIDEAEVVHKDGRGDDPRLQDPKQVTLADFHILSKEARKLKRHYCKECRLTGKRFDARVLGIQLPNLQVVSNTRAVAVVASGMNRRFTCFMPSGTSGSTRDTTTLIA